MPAASCSTQTNLAAQSATAEGSTRGSAKEPRHTPLSPWGDKARGPSPAPCPGGDRVRGQHTAWCGKWAGSSPCPWPPQSMHRTHSRAGCRPLSPGRWRLDPCQSYSAPQEFSQKPPQEPAQPQPQGLACLHGRGGGRRTSPPHSGLCGD